MTPTIEIPSPNEVFKIKINDGSEIKIRRYVNLGKPCLLLSHGNGFAMDAYAPFWGPLQENFDLCIYDQRHHGWNDPPPTHKTGFKIFASDLDQIITQLRRIYIDTPIFGVYHSLSAVASLLHALTYTNQLDALILFDPPLQPPKQHSLYDLAHKFEMMLSDWSRKRQNIFSSPKELAEQFLKSRSLSGWVPGAHYLMAKSILKQHGATWNLICPRNIESQIYLDNANLIIWDFHSTLTVPVAIIHADPTHPAGQAPGQVCASLASESALITKCIKNTTHLLQIEEPEKCREALYSVLKEITDVPNLK